MDNASGNGNNFFNASSNMGGVNNNNNNGGFNLSNLFNLNNLFGNNNPLSGLTRMFNRNMFNRNSRPNTSYRGIRVLPIEEAYRIIKSGKCFLLDVRTEMEYSTIRIKSSVNIPLDRLEKEAPNIIADKNEMIIVYCATGSRVRRAMQILWSLGYNNVYIWEGAGINTFAFADLIVYNNRQLENLSN